MTVRDVAIFDVIDKERGAERFTDLWPAASGVVFYGGYHRGLRPRQRQQCCRRRQRRTRHHLCGRRLLLPRWPLWRPHLPGVQHGFTVKGTVRSHDPNGVVRGFTAWNVRDIGIWGYNAGDLPVIAGVIIANAKDGLVWSNLGPDPTEHEVRRQRLTVRDSAFVGQTVHGERRCFDEQAAILLPVTNSLGFGISPEQCGPIGGGAKYGVYGPSHPTGSYPTLAFETRVTRVGFYGYGGAGCEGMSRLIAPLMGGGMNSSDAISPIFFSQTRVDAASRAALAYLKPPQRSWIKPGKCVVMDCDGPKHAFAVDLDGSLTGLGERSSIVARAEFMNERRADPAQFTWYNIPWKMLLDPAPLNDRTDPGWDMSQYHEFAGPGFQFTYRRLAEEEAAAAAAGEGGAETRPLARVATAAAGGSWRARRRPTFATEWSSISVTSASSGPTAPTPPARRATRSLRCTTRRAARGGRRIARLRTPRTASGMACTAKGARRRTSTMHGSAAVPT